jgi:predicted DNA-binding ribbon-helix-helix protein
LPRGQAVKAPKRIIAKRSIVISGRQTSVSVEDQFWTGLAEIATELKLPIRALVTSINTDREHSNLSSAIRVFVLRYYRDRTMLTRAE